MSIIDQLNTHIDERQRQLREADERLSIAKRLLAPILDTNGHLEPEVLLGKRKLAAADKPRKRHVTPGHKNLYARKVDGSFVQFVCPVCGRDKFLNSLGFINHSRIVHQVTFTSFYEASLTCSSTVSELEVPLDDPCRTRDAIDDERLKIPQKKRWGSVVQVGAERTLKVDPLAPEPTVVEDTDSEYDIPTGVHQPVIDMSQTADDIETTRVTRFCVRKRIVVGNTSELIDRSNGEETFNWTLYIRGSDEEPDISFYVRSVRVYLHPYFAPHDVIELEQPPFQFCKTGLGQFPLRVRIEFHDPANKPADIIHVISLSSGSPIGQVVLGGETFADVELARAAFDQYIILQDGALQMNLLPCNPNAVPASWSRLHAAMFPAVKREPLVDSPMSDSLKSESSETKVPQIWDYQLNSESFEMDTADALAAFGILSAGLDQSPVSSTKVLEPFTGQAALDEPGRLRNRRSAQTMVDTATSLPTRRIAVAKESPLEKSVKPTAVRSNMVVPTDVVPVPAVVPTTVTAYEHKSWVATPLSVDVLNNSDAKSFLKRMAVKFPLISTDPAHGRGVRYNVAGSDVMYNSWNSGKQKSAEVQRARYLQTLLKANLNIDWPTKTVVQWCRHNGLSPNHRAYRGTVQLQAEATQARSVSPAPLLPPPSQPKVFSSKPIVSVAKPLPSTSLIRPVPTKPLPQTPNSVPRYTVQTIDVTTAFFCRYCGCIHQPSSVFDSREAACAARYRVSDLYAKIRHCTPHRTLMLPVSSAPEVQSTGISQTALFTPARMLSDELYNLENPNISLLNGSGSLPADSRGEVYNGPTANDYYHRNMELMGWVRKSASQMGMCLDDVGTARQKSVESVLFASTVAFLRALISSSLIVHRQQMSTDLPAERACKLLMPLHVHRAISTSEFTDFLSNRSYS